MSVAVGAADATPWRGYLAGYHRDRPGITSHDENTATAEVAPALAKGAQDVVRLTVSRRNCCHYCVTVHSTNALRSGMDSETVTALREDNVADLAHTPLDDEFAARTWEA